MVDKAKAFDLILRKAEFKAVVEIEGKRFNIGNKPKEFTDPTLTKEEYECIMKCANAEPDSIEKIIEEFKELGWQLEENDTYQNEKICFSKKNGVWWELLINRESIYKESWIKEIYPNGKWAYTAHILPISNDELRLINRIYRLWGVEV